MHRLTPHRIALALYAVLYGAAVWYFNLGRPLFFTDNLARIMNAQNVLFSRDPHLAAIGFVWTPLPSLVELPLVILLRPLGATVLAGGVMSALFSVLNIHILRRIVHQVGVDGWKAYFLVAVYGCSPFVILYAANGMSEAPFMTTVLLVTTGMITWYQQESPASLLLAGMSCALAFMIRYESVMLSAAGALLIAIVWWARYRGDFDRLEGEAVAFLAPIVYSLGVWVFANWTIMGSPMFFLNGKGSNADQLAHVRANPGSLAGLYSIVLAEYHKPMATLTFVLARIMWFMPALIPLCCVAAVMYGRKRRLLDLLPILLPLSVVGFQVYALYSGQSFGEFRYYSYAVPAGIIAAALILSGMPARGFRGYRELRPVLVVLVLASCLISVPSTLLAMTQANVGRQESVAMDAITGHRTQAVVISQYSAERAMAHYIDRHHLPNGSVLTDSALVFAVALFSNDPKRFIVASDPDYESDLAVLPTFHGYVLVSYVQTTVASLVFAKYPALATNTAKWARLVHREGKLRLYKTVGNGQK